MKFQVQVTLNLNFKLTWIGIYKSYTVLFQHGLQYDYFGNRNVWIHMDKQSFIFRKGNL